MTLFFRTSILLIIGTIFSCQAPSKEVTNEIEAPEIEVEENALKASYESITDEQGLTTLEIAITPPEDDKEFTEKAVLSSGKILFDKYQEVTKQNKKFDHYKVSYGQYSVVELSHIEMSNVLRKKKVFEDRIALLENKKYDELFATFDEHYRTLMSSASFAYDAESDAVTNYSNFAGFQVVKLAGDKYLRLAQSNAQGAQAILTFKLNKEENTLHGYSFTLAP